MHMNLEWKKILLTSVAGIILVAGFFSAASFAHAQYVNYDELWLTPGETVQLVPSTTTPETFASQSSSIVTVSPTGTVYAAGLGDAVITVAVGASTEKVLAHVNPENDTPNFGSDGSENTSYIPGKSIYVTSMFGSLAGDLSTYANAFKQAGMNTADIL